MSNVAELPFEVFLFQVVQSLCVFWLRRWVKRPQPNVSPDVVVNFTLDLSDAFKQLVRGPLVAVMLICHWESCAWLWLYLFSLRGVYLGLCSATECSSTSFRTSAAKPVRDLIVSPRQCF